MNSVAEREDTIVQEVSDQGRGGTYLCSPDRSCGTDGVVAWRERSSKSRTQRTTCGWAANGR